VTSHEPAPVRPVDRVGQASGYSSRTTNIPRSLVTPQGYEQKHIQNTPCKQEEPFSKPSKTTPNRPRTDQQQHNQKTHGSGKSPETNPTKRLTPIRPVKSTGQTGHVWAARDEQHPWVNSPKSNSRSPDSLHGFAQDFGDSRNTSWHSIDKLWSTKTR
jgi:hypothetical protein